jgi:hypothetical protein
VPKIPDPYDRVEWRGRLTDYATAAAGVALEQVLGYRLTVLQAVGGAPASGGTHLGRKGADGQMEGGRCLDLAPYDVDRKATEWRKIAGPGWPRAELPGVWGPHGHLVNRFDGLFNKRGLAAAAVDQLGKYDRKEDGLAGSNPDRSGLIHPQGQFTMDDYRRIMTTVGLEGAPLPTGITRVRDALVEEDADLGKVIAMLRALPEADWVTKDIKKLQKDRTDLRAMLERMPKR